MLKTQAIELLGGTVTAAANAVGISPSAVTQWPDELPPRIEDRVLAALARKHLPPELLGEPAAEPEPKAA
ncbi:Cro/CI family transcriptional regulator [Variovorax sp. ZT5P49]|uniref:Cro/CI family transcriptional regulator n=1 Tax=Variovorax sp. ZT5P49 TaxID=3443733 RepID=UPI003F498685